ncbi:MAG: hypothetical protein KUG82_01280 [Pseudomonadales bacterium]|nr:hypothetical protein [Pseudomonadales bacterium]
MTKRKNPRRNDYSQTLASYRASPPLSKAAITINTTTNPKENKATFIEAAP